MNIAGIEIGPDQPCRFVAELSNNANGDLGRAIRIIDAAKEAGADLMKFQCYTPGELVALRGDGPAPDPWGSEGWSMRDLYTKAQTPHEWFPTLVAHCKAIGLPWFSSVFGPDSLELLEGLGCPAYKIAALDSHLRSWRNMVSVHGKPIITSTRAPHAALKCGPQLYCPEGYPQTEFHLKNIRNGFVGFSYHGTDEDVPITAAILGASMVEAHMELFGEPSELETDVSLTDEQFAEMVDETRRYEEWIL